MAISATATPEEVLSYDDARALVRALDARLGAEAMKANAAYLSGDHWQDGRAWGGPSLPPGIAGYAETKKALKLDQAPVPVIEEAVEAFVTGVAGNEPAFLVELDRELEEGEELSEQESEDIGLLNDALTAFFDGTGALEEVQDFVENLCSGRGVLRFFMPPEVAEKTVSFANPIEAAANFYLEAPEWDRAGVHTNPRSMERMGLYLYSQEEAATNTRGAARTVNRDGAEITFINEQGLTVLRTIEKEREVAEQSFDCNGQIWLYQATLKKPLINQAQRDLQRKIDFLNYILPKNAQYAGFRERHFVGVDRPKDESGNETDPELGPGKVGFWQPSYYVDKEGNLRPGTASLILTEPVDSGPIRDDIDHLIRVLLKSVKQLHTVISGDAVASAISRVQSRAQFVKALFRLKPKVERVLRDLFETVLCLACQLSGETALLDRFKQNYRIRVDVKPDAGPLTAEEIRVIVELWKAGLLDRETAQTMIGLEDIGSIANALARDEENNLDMQVKRAQLFNEYANIFDALDAAEMAGLPEHIIEKIKEVNGDPDGDSDDDGDDDQ